MNKEVILHALQEGRISLKDAKRKLTGIIKKTSENSSDVNKSDNMIERSYPEISYKANDINNSRQCISNDIDSRLSSGEDSIAIIGMSGRYPGASDLDEYWDNLVKGKNSIREIPSSRWDVDEYYDPVKSKKGKMYCKWLGALDDIDMFDPLFFNISPMEAEVMDPQHRLFLQEGYKAFQDAGYGNRILENTKCGVYLGIMSSEYNIMSYKNKSDTVYISGNSYAIAAARIAYYLNLKGPAISLDTACSSALVATHLGCKALLNHEIDMALVGGVTLYLIPESYIVMCKAGMLSSDGQCKTFDNDADGFVPGEGVGALVLKRLKDAIADRDHIYGVIIGSGINHDGKTNGISAPSINSQIELEREIYNRYKINPETISYVEMHGTGTKLGDPIELNALSTVYKEKTQNRNYCAIGSVKTNIGHTSAASGVAGIQKILLSLKHNNLVPTLNYNNPNEHFNIDDSPFYINTELKHWERKNEDTRRAGVSSFGFSGTNSHIVIEEYLSDNDYALGISPDTVQLKQNQYDIANHIIILSAKNEEQLKIYASKMTEFLEKGSNPIINEHQKNQQLNSEIQKKVTKIVSEILGISEKEIDPDVELNEYGIDPVGISSLFNKINECFDVNIPNGLYGEAVTVTIITKHLLGKGIDRLFSEIGKTDINIEDVAFTLQVGRDEMEERLALVVTCINDIVDKLKLYLNGKQNIEGLYYGNKKRDRDKLKHLIDKENIKEALIENNINNEVLRKLARLWVFGMDIEWSQLYLDSNPCRLPLPSYPFAREKYWLTEKPGPEIVREIKDNFPSCNKINTKKVILKKEFKEKEISEQSFETDSVAVILGTSKTIQLANTIFKDNKRVSVLIINHNKIETSQAPIIDFYQEMDGLHIYEIVKKKINGQKNWGIIDITAFDEQYENSVNIEAGKIRFLQKIVEDTKDKGCKILQVTSNLNSFQLNSSTMCGARLSGLYRMLGTEYKRINSITMDSDCSIDGIHTLAKQIQIEFLWNDHSISECCYRNNIRYEPCLATEWIDSDCYKVNKINYNEHDVILITGGTGGIGIHIASNIISQGAKKVILMGREKLPAESEWNKIQKGDEKPEIIEKIENIKMLINKGASVRYYNTSLTDSEMLKSMVDEINRDFGNITGVFHCAGVNSANPVFYKKTIKDMETVCDPKIKGLSALHKALENESLSFLFLFSSISSIVPSLAVGFSDYAMANAYMDYYAINQNSHGNKSVHSIQWPVWQKTGMAEMMPDNFTYDKNGILPHSVQDGLKFIDFINHKTLAASLPCEINPEKFTLDKILMAKNTSNREENAPLSSKRSSNADEKLIDRGGDNSIKNHIIKWLFNIIEKELKIPFEKIESDRPFDEYGVDSIIIAQLTHVMQEDLKLALDPSLMLINKTINELADYFEENYQVEFKKSMHLEDYEANKKIVQNKQNDELKSSIRFSGYSSQACDDIAIVGLSCRFPDSQTKEEYWKLLAKGKSAIRPVTGDRWITKGNRKDYGGWITEIDLFDPEFFNINIADAAIMDPQARIILEESLKAIYDAGYEHKELSNQKVGVYIGGRSKPTSDFNSILNAPNPVLGIGQNYLATNISMFYNFKGPSIVIDTACSSGITGMLIASDSLRNRRIDTAMVGTVSLLLNQASHDMFESRNILNKDGKFHIFDALSGGEVLGEGSGVIILKRLDDAIKDGNKIYCILKGIATNNNGRTIGPGSPSLESQKQVMIEALDLSNKQVEDIGYIEANGGGSPIIDSIEIKSLSEVYQLSNQYLEQCFIGSIKPNIGHLLMSSGLASFIRCVLSVYYKKIPPFLSANNPFKYYDFNSSRISFNRELIEWQIASGKKRIAAMNSFPDGGTNGHVIIEEFVPDESYQQKLFEKKIPQLNKKRFPYNSSTALHTHNKKITDDKNENNNVKELLNFEKKSEKIEFHNPSLKKAWG